MTREDYKKYVDDTFVFLAISDTYSLIDKIFDELEQRIIELEYNYSCVLDNATGGRASKTNIDLNTAYKLIADSTNFWVESAIAELEAPKTCEGCELDNGTMKARSSLICAYCIRVATDYYKPKGSK